MGECAITWGVDGVAAEPTPKLVIKLVDPFGNPLQGYKIEGLTDIDETKCVTMEDGTVTLRNTWGTYTVSAPTANCIDAVYPETTIQLAEGDSKEFLLSPSPVSSPVKIKTTQNIQFSSMVDTIDIFCVGGGGGGGGGSTGADSSLYRGCGGGGGGGYTKTAKNVPFDPYTQYSAIVGTGGYGGSGSTSSSVYSGGTGGRTSLLGISANGGTGGGGGVSNDVGPGGNGGSGGGYGGDLANRKSPGYGGTDGSDSNCPAYGYSDKCGKGQGTTTRAFGESNGELFASGGDGGTDSQGGTSSLAGSGGGGGSARGRAGTTGNDGLIMIRWTNKSTS